MGCLSRSIIRFFPRNPERLRDGGSEARQLDFSLDDSFDDIVANMPESSMCVHVDTTMDHKGYDSFDDIVANMAESSMRVAETSMDRRAGLVRKGSKKERTPHGIGVFDDSFDQVLSTIPDSCMGLSAVGIDTEGDLFDDDDDDVFLKAVESTEEGTKRNKPLFSAVRGNQLGRRRNDEFRVIGRLASSSISSVKKTRVTKRPVHCMSTSEDEDGEVDAGEGEGTPVSSLIFSGGCKCKEKICKMCEGEVDCHLDRSGACDGTGNSCTGEER